MKFLIALLLLFFTFWRSSAIAQEKDVVYFFNVDWKPAEEKKAIYLLHLHVGEDSFRQYSYYKNFGPLIRIESFRDEGGKVRYGLFAWYNATGLMDSSGYYYDGLTDKTWYYLDAKGKLLRSKDYDKGVLLKETDLRLVEKGSAAKDTTNHSTGKDGNEAEFPGGNIGWLQYLNRNFRYPDRAVYNEIQGDVRIFYNVDTTGKIIDAEVIKSVEFSMDQQSLWIIRNSPDWIPALLKGEKVKSFKIQPIFFKMDIMR